MNPFNTKKAKNTAGAGLVLSLTALLFFVTYPNSILSAYAEYKVVRGTVTNVSDGDTVTIRPSGGRPIRCRLYGIDAPELAADGNPGQPYGIAADRELRNIVLNETVYATLTGKESYDRDVCIIKKTGGDISLEMVRRGYAWAYRQYLSGPYESKYIEAEKEARKMRRGLWQQMNPTPPWEFRHRRP